MASLPTAVRSTTPKLVKSAIQRRALSDVHITRTGKPIIRTQGGRSSLGGHTATVFGATGQLGRYIVNRLARQGCTVIIPYREEMAKRHLKPTGDLGKVIMNEYDLRNTQSIEESVRHSDVVYNLVGRNYPTKNFTLEDVHVEATERIAEAVAKYDVDRFIHVSSYNADPNSPSEFFATKGRSEHVARSIYPETTIVRPAPMFGFEDNLLLKLASIVNFVTSNNMKERYWPVHVIDVGEALEKMLFDDSTAAQTYELYGPKNYSTAEIAEMVDREIFKKRRHINIPKAILKPIAGLLNKALWWNMMSADEIEREFHDQVIDDTAKTFKDLGIEPTDISKWTYHYLQGFRSSTFYDLPPATEKEKAEDKKVLSSSALDALKEFYAERDARAEQFAKLQQKAEEQHAETQKLSMEAFTEDWNESQFWYSDECASFLAKQLLKDATPDMTIAVVSAPSVFVQLKNILNAADPAQPKPKLVLLEHDNRFAVFPEFVFYDFAQPTKLPAELKSSIDRMIVDPPFLSEDCQTKAAITVQWMFKKFSNLDEKPRLIVCTGERMEALVSKLYKSYGLYTTDYDPVHARGLSNEFYCYANFGSLGWKVREGK
ncbi:putative N6-adenine methyltransferase-domain-containing protein [Cladorrhinum sp. PSN259]|nr:putative N6-adenine methyltransferase-domain-containing protein [Cladorrhinum sp. PSN259]